MDSVEKLREFRKNVPPSILANDAAREAALLEARKLLLALERPQNVVHRLGFQLMETVACSIAIKTGLFRALNSSSSPRSLSYLAETCGVDPLLMGRVLRCLASYGAVGQEGPDSFTSNMVVRTLARKESEAAIEWDLEFLGRSWPLIPSFLEQRGWKNFTATTDTPLALAWNLAPGEGLFEALGKSPHNAAFNTYMSVFDEGHQSWLEFYPIERITNGLHPKFDSPLFVDIGGGSGHQTVKFKKHVKLPGRYIVQDLSHAFPADDDKVEGVEYMAHNFKEPQPVKGARVYYMRYVPHDWPQEFNIKLCKLIREAMKPGYSKLIINEWIIPEVEPSSFMTSMDLTMMAAHGGMERTEKLHREYLENAGLKVTGIYRPGDNLSEGVIEAELV